MKLSKITSEIVGTPHTPAGQSKEEGFDCLTMFVRAAEIIGQELPTEFGAFQRKDYAEQGVKLWRKNRRKAMLILIRFLRSIGMQIEPKNRLPGDIVMVRILDMKKIVFGILAGPYEILCSLEDEGNKIVDLKKVRHEFKEVIRWGI